MRQQLPRSPLHRAQLTVRLPPTRLTWDGAWVLCAEHEHENGCVRLVGTRGQGQVRFPHPNARYDFVADVELRDSSPDSKTWRKSPRAPGDVGGIRSSGVSEDLRAEHRAGEAPRSVDDDADDHALRSSSAATRRSRWAVSCASGGVGVGRFLLLVIMVTTSRQFVIYRGTCLLWGNTAMERGRVFMICFPYRTAGP
jgi:hypothetical protein